MNDSLITYAVDAMETNTELWGLKLAFPETLFTAACLKMHWHLVTDLAHHNSVLTKTPLACRQFKTSPK